MASNTAPTTLASNSLNNSTRMPQPQSCSGLSWRGHAARRLSHHSLHLCADVRDINNRQSSTCPAIAGRRRRIVNQRGFWILCNLPGGRHGLFFARPYHSPFQAGISRCPHSGITAILAWRETPGTLSRSLRHRVPWLAQRSCLLQALLARTPAPRPIRFEL
jgi:hypothetical protein